MADPLPRAERAIPAAPRVGAHPHVKGVRLALLVVCAPGLLLAGRAVRPTDVAAVTSFPYSSVAAANGVVNTVSGNSVPDGAEFEADGPTAQAAVDSSGRSTGLASLLYPGTYLLSIPGLLASQGAPEPPPYPLLVQSDPAHPSVETSGSGYDLKANSTDRSSQSTASTGSNAATGTIGSASATTKVRADTDTGVVTAMASSLTEVIDVPPLRVGRVDSEAAATREADGHLTRSSSLVVGDVTVNGIQVGVTDKGVVAPGQTVPLPGNPVADQLLSAGITVTYIAARDLPDGVLSAGVAITVSVPGSGVTTTTTLGQSLALASRDVASTATLEPVPSVVSPTAAGLALPAGPGSSGSDLGPIASAPPATPSAAAPPPAGQGATASEPALTAHPLPPLPATGFYLVLVAAAVAALGVGQAIRWGGIRWSRSS